MYIIVFRKIISILVLNLLSISRVLSVSLTVYNIRYICICRRGCTFFFVLLIFCCCRLVLLCKIIKGKMLYHGFRWGSAVLRLASLQLVPQFHNFACNHGLTCHNILKKPTSSPLLLLYL